MNKIVLDTVSPLHKTGHASKGDQRKWKIEDIWYKADYMGYESLAVKLSEFPDVAEKIQYLVEQIEEITHIRNFGKYITAILEIDVFFLNEDRHTNNIAVIYNEKTGQYSLSPIFDQGLCLFSDTSYDYPIDLSVEKCMQKIEAKPFHSDFDVQLEAAENLYGNQIEFTFTIKEVQEILNQFKESYSDKIRERVESLLRTQIRKYAYLMRRS